MKKLSFILMLTVLFTFTSTLATAQRCQATTKKGTQCKRKAVSGSIYCYQHGGTSSHSKSKNTSYGISGSASGEIYNGKTVYTGPRGGKYYINGNGKKVYIKRR